MIEVAKANLHDKLLKYRPIPRDVYSRDTDGSILRITENMADRLTQLQDAVNSVRQITVVCCLF